MRRVIGRSERRCEKKLDYCDDYITRTYITTVRFSSFFLPCLGFGGAVSFV